MTNSTAQHSRLHYRKDIDGLRAIAVLSVIFFHLNHAWASGGFVGVDLFFVISGYLITGQIRNDLADNAFSVKKFYLRRIRRIVPPLLAMLVTVSFVAWLVLKPEDIQSFAYSLVVQPFSLQNLVFLAEGDYFRGSETKALLHTWSLAVEEQFYLFWPLLLLLLKRWTFKPLLAVICVIIAVSFYLSATMTLSAPQAAFFLIITRAWELGLGGVAALMHEHEWQQSKLSAKQYEVLSWLSVAALGYAIFYINAGMPFPGKVALIPVLAAFFVVLCGSAAQTTVSKILSLPLLVKIGLISYPLYLWHWPVLVFMQHLHIKPTDSVPLLSFFALTFGLAYVSYRWLEIPIRRKVWLTSPFSLLTAATITFGTLTVFCIHVYVTDGASYRFNEKARAFLTARIQSYTKRCDVSAIAFNPFSPICKLRAEVSDQRKLLLWGNSHASMLIPMLKQLAEQNRTSLYVNTNNCRPLAEPTACNADINARIMAKIKEKAIGSVIFASSWGGIDDPALEHQFTNTVSSLSEQNVTIWLVVDSPSGAALDPVTAFTQNPDNPQFGSIALDAYNKNSRLKELALFQRLQEKFPNVHIIDASLVLCDKTQCWGGKGNDVWYRDSGHLNNAGSLAVSDFFLPSFQ